ncbi:lipid A deacylase LpxR family protein [Pedobacter sp. BS3]|uniref:lipid A deacylase LpxR family protein n=1 Tax=Pedobacter sp. BS3 TaxID=2567937 RepID=UPI0011EDC2A2|nr:lipid A deacylase LpxR family protein [Pedobacter sp. BS3]TZF84716.1 lipid A deacylase LpxR family protein [Pedobacter sp. BS3]
MHSRIIIFLLFITVRINAQTYSNEFTLTSDNDFYTSGYKYDRYYTNGLMLRYRHALKPAADSTKRILGFEFGQMLFNPYSTKVPNAADQDRPFTAYLFAGVTLHRFYKNENNLLLSAQLGTIGPMAAGREVQVTYHKLFGLYPVQGWKYQLNNEPGINLAATYNNLFFRNSKQNLDISGTYSAKLGNTFSGASAGFRVRLGRMNAFNQSAAFNSRVNSRLPAGKSPQRELFVYTVPLINYVVYDATIQGGLFRENKGPVTFGIHHWVYAQQLGVQYAKNHWGVNAAIIAKTREVKSTATGYQYGSITISYRFE